MVNLSDEVFATRRVTVDPTAQIVFVADLFAEDYVGGAELTSEALIESSPFRVQKIRSKDVNLDVLKSGHEKFWIFGNFSQLNPQLIPTIVANIKYTVLEYDYKFCRFRSPEKHQAETGSACDCADQMNGKVISAFFHGSMGLWWMSEAQKTRYIQHFPFLSEKSSIVLSSVFSHATLGSLKLLREQAKAQGIQRKSWIVLGSQSWVKGFDAAKKWCEERNEDHEVVWNLPYDQVLSKLASAKGFVYLPAGADTCPRMVIEAKLLGCELQINDNVQHANEEWFATDDIESIGDYLFAAHNIFWNGVKSMMEYQPKISGYTTAYNCHDGSYPFEASIRSMLQFCDEVCVVDGGSTDGTWETLQVMANHDHRIKIKQINRDWNHPRSGLYDGAQKAEARNMCTGDFCWQSDSDEVVHEDDVEKIKKLCRSFPGGARLLCLPVIEYWGSFDKVRVDVNPWKWRLSKNDPDITHGIRIECRKYDENGDVYSTVSDGADMISKRTGELITDCLNFYTQEVHNARMAAMAGNVEALQAYENWFNRVVNELPGVFHYSWHDLPRKIKLYKKFWSRHWDVLFGGEGKDTAENNMFFDLPWSEVTDEMIDKRSEELKKIGGWIWHRKWDGTITPHMKINRDQPKVMK